MIFIFKFLHLNWALKRNTPARLFLQGTAILLATGLLHILLFKVFESVTWSESFWQTWQTFTTVGYGNRPVETPGGRWTTVLFGTMGIAFLGVIISQLFELKQERRDKRRFGMLSNPVKEGVVIFNYPGPVMLQGIVREIRYIYHHMGFCIVDEKIKELPQDIIELDNIFFIRGELLKEDTYKMAALYENRIVIVFPTEMGLSSSDGVTQLVVRKAARFMKESARLLYVQVDPGNDWLFAKSPGTPILQSFAILAVVQEATDKYSSSLVEEMFLNTSGVKPKTVKPKRTVGWTWFDFHAIAIETGRKTGIRINPLGLVKNGKALSCPPFDTVIEKDDSLSVVVRKGFEWDAFEQRMEAERKKAT